MADWYVSSTSYAAVSVFAINNAYTVGQLVRPSAPVVGAQYVYRCTTGGTSAGTEPTWNRADNATTTTGGAVFTNVSGQATYNWATAVGTLLSLTNSGGYKNASSGDRIFISSDHSESVGAAYAFGNSGFNQIRVYSVNKAGSVPPVAADITNGAAIACPSGVFAIDSYCNMYWQGFIFTQNASNILQLGYSYQKNLYFKNCAFAFGSSSSGRIGCVTNRVTLDNCTIQFGATAQGWSQPASAQGELIWINTPSAIQGATLPATLFLVGNSSLLATLRGVDLSALTGNLLTASTGYTFFKILLDSCRIASGVTRYAGTPVAGHDELELVNCYDGTHFINERYVPTGVVTTEFSTTMVGGATDDVGLFSHKMVSNARTDAFIMPLESFWLDVENTAVGSSLTATVHIVSSASLNNTDIRLLLEYEGTASSSIASFADTLSTPLTASAALGASSATWNNPPATPQYQQLQVAFTPQVAGRVRGRVMLGKASTTIWVNPQVIIT